MWRAFSIRGALVLALTCSCRAPEAGPAVAPLSPECTGVVDLASMQQDLWILEPGCRLGWSNLSSEQLAREQAVYRAAYRRVLLSWAPLAGRGATLERWMRQCDVADRQHVLRLAHLFAQGRFPGVLGGDEPVGAPAATARFRELVLSIDAWLLSGGGDEPLRHAVLDDPAFPADVFAGELARLAVTTFPDAAPSLPRRSPGSGEPRYGREETARLVFAQLCRVDRPPWSAPLAQTLRAWYRTSEALWRNGNDPSVCAARLLLGHDREEDRIFLLDQVFGEHPHEPEVAAGALGRAIRSEDVHLVRRAYQAIGPRWFSPRNGSPARYQAVLIERAGLWNLVVEDLRSRNVVRVNRALALVPYSRDRRVDAAMAALHATDLARLDATGAPEAWGMPRELATTIAEVERARDLLRSRYEPLVGTALVSASPFPVTEPWRD